MKYIIWDYVGSIFPHSILTASRLFSGRQKLKLCPDNSYGPSRLRFETALVFGKMHAWICFGRGMLQMSEGCSDLSHLCEVALRYMDAPSSAKSPKS